MLDSLVVQGKAIPFDRTKLDVDQVHLDPKNPRIQYMIGQRQGNVSENDLYEMLWDKDPVKALAESIKQNGGVYEAIIVQRQDGKLIVREGNCRVVSCRHLSEQNPDDSRFRNVPAMVFDVELTDEDLATLLADMHVANKIRWDAYEQAQRIYELYHKYGKTMDWLANHLRMGKSRIQQDLEAYRATTEYLQAHPDPNNLSKFAFYQELMRKKDLREGYRNDVQFKQRFDRWVTEGKLSASVQVRDLDEVLANDEAAKALDGSGFKDAYSVLVRQDPAKESELFSAVKDATEQLKKAPASDIQDLKTNPQKLIMLRNLNRAIEDLATLAQVKL